MEQEIRAYEAQNKTGNKVLDTILTTKSLQCQRQGNSPMCVVDGKEMAFMNSMVLERRVFGVLQKNTEAL